MSPDSAGNRNLSPDDAFAVLGNEIRITIMQTLGEAREPVSFSELRDRVDIDDSGRFNYHLDQLVGHFVRKTENGYTLRQAGRRVVEATFSGIVTDDPVMQPAPVDGACYYCGGPIVVGYRQEQVNLYCTECNGTYGETHASEDISVPDEYGWLGGLPLPPAGVENRPPEEVLTAALTLGQTEFVSMSNGVCPRCSGSVGQFVRICDHHDASDGLCSECDRRREVVFGAECTNCNHSAGGGIHMVLLANTEFLAFLTTHGFHPTTPDSVLDFYQFISAYETEIRSKSPLQIDFTLTVDGETFTHEISELPVKSTAD